MKDKEFMWQGATPAQELSFPSRFVVGWKKFFLQNSIHSHRTAHIPWLVDKGSTLCFIWDNLKGCQLQSSFRIWGGFAATTLRFYFCFILLSASLAGADLRVVLRSLLSTYPRGRQTRDRITIGTKNWYREIQLEEQTEEFINQKDVCLSGSEKVMRMWVEVNDEMGTRRLFMAVSCIYFSM